MLIFCENIIPLSLKKINDKKRDLAEVVDLTVLFFNGSPPNNYLH